MRDKLKKARVQAGMTQQQMAEYLHVSLVYYQKNEAGTRTGDFEIWDALEDITGIHQRELRMLSEKHPDPKDNP